MMNGTANNHPMRLRPTAASAAPNNGVSMERRYHKRVGTTTGGPPNGTPAKSATTADLTTGSGAAPLLSRMKTRLTSRSTVVRMRQFDTELMRRLHDDCESTVVMVGRVDYLQVPVSIFVRLRSAVDFGDLCEVPKPTRFVYVLLGPADAGLDYHQVGRAMATLLANESFRAAAYAIASRKQFMTAINDFFDGSIVVPPGDIAKRQLVDFHSLRFVERPMRRRRVALTLSNMPQSAAAHLGTYRMKAVSTSMTLRRTGRWFGGIRDELTRRMRLYPSDFTDSLNWKCASSVFYVFFTCLFPAITFGSILSKFCGSGRDHF